MKNNQLIKFLLFAFFTFFIFNGCGGFYYKVKVNGYSNTDNRILSNRVFIIGNSFKGNTILRDEVQTKLQNALIKKGLTPTQSMESADHVLLFSFGIDTGQPRTYSYEETRLNIFSGQLEPTTRVGSATVYTRTLILNLYDGEQTRDLANQIRQGKISATDAADKIQPVWIGEVFSTGSSSDLRSVIDYLIYAGFEHFGENTSKQVPHIYLKNDEDVRNLVKSPPIADK